MTSVCEEHEKTAPGLRQRGQAGVKDENAPEDAAEAREGNNCKNGAQHGSRAGMSDRCRCFLASPQYKMMTFSLVAFVPVFGVFFTMPSLLRALGLGGNLLGQARHYLLGMWISTQFLYNFAMTQHTDPGSSFLVKPAYEATGQFELVIGVDENGAEETLLYAPNWCEHCQHWKPPRSHHCSMCRRCTLRMDHHCPFTGNCIGMRNHGHFFLMYIFAMVGLLYALYLCIFANLACQEENALRPAHTSIFHALVSRMTVSLVGMLAQMVLKVLENCGFEVALFTFASAIAALAVSCMGTPALNTAARNVTVLERIFPMKEYIQIQPKIFCPLGVYFYDRRWKSNLREILGPRWRWRLLLPVKGGPVDLAPGTRPTASVEGGQALRQRRIEVDTNGVDKEVRSTTDLGLNPGPLNGPQGNV